MIANFKTRKINDQPEKKLNDILKKARLQADLSLAKVEKETKIKKEYLKMMEVGNISKLPEEIYVRGFLKSLAKLYKIDASELINCYFRQKKCRGKKTEKTINFRNSRLNKPTVIVTPKIISIGLAVLVGIGLISYLWLEVSGFAIAPKLSLTNPKEDSFEIRKDQILINGETDQNASISINKEVIPVSENGDFKEIVRLQPGYNELNIQAKNQGGKTTSKNISIMVLKDNEKISQIGK
jgi:cytoskeletal protein RodZ